MLTFPSSVRLYLATAPTDLRKGFDGLSTLVESELGLSPLRGDLFIFLNRRATQVEIDAGEFAMLLEGIDAQRVRRRKRYRPAKEEVFVQSPGDCG